MLHHCPFINVCSMLRGCDQIMINSKQSSESTEQECLPWLPLSYSSFLVLLTHWSGHEPQTFIWSNFGIAENLSANRRIRLQSLLLKSELKRRCVSVFTLAKRYSSLYTSYLKLKYFPAFALNDNFYLYLELTDFLSILGEILFK